MYKMNICRRPQNVQDMRADIKTGAQTKRPATKRPEGQNVRRKNVRRPKVSQTKRPSDKMYGGTKRPAGENIQGDKKSGDQRPAGQNVRRGKRPFANICGPTLLNPASKHSFTKNKNNHSLFYEATAVPCSIF